MAEILGPLGTTTALLGLVFATIPTTIKTHKSFVECIDQFGRYKVRVSNFEAKLASLLERSQRFVLCEGYDTRSIIHDIDQLSERINLEFKKHEITETGLDMWRTRRQLPKGTIQDLKMQPTDYFPSTLYACTRRTYSENGSQ
jgi:hypothetical protein